MVCKPSSDMDLRGSNEHFKNSFEMRSGGAQTAPMSSTRERLLAAAQEVFAAHGYRDATIQRIAELAEANIAAVHYHFGGKAELCAAVIERELEQRTAGAPLPRLADAPGDPAGQLGRFLRWFLLHRVACDPGGVMLRLTGELSAMGEVLDLVIARHIRGELGALQEIVAALLPPGAPRALLRRAVIAVLGQCATYRHAAPVHARLFPELNLDAAELEAIAEQTTAFSLAGLAALRERGTRA